MDLLLQREPSSEHCTHGKLSIDDGYFCETLEDVVREAKIYGETAIPAGRYSVIKTMSNRFKVELPLLVDVPEFEGIRIHAGNTDKDTNGCILLGKERTQNEIHRSREALAEFLEKFQEPCWITVKDAGDSVQA